MIEELYIKILIKTFLGSISPLGEGKVWIPWAIEKHGVNREIAFLVGVTANLLIFPLFYRSINFLNKILLKYSWYKKSAIKLSLRARKKTKTFIKKYGIWGLMVFVMIPVPFTGAYIGTIAAYIYALDYKKSLIFINSGVSISCFIIAFGWGYVTYLFDLVLNLF